MTDRRRAGVVLPVVLFFALLLVASVATFTKRSVVDAMISHNRNAASQAETLARGGVRIARALLFEDILQETQEGVPFDSLDDGWARVREVELEEGALRVTVEDAGARFNLNSLFVVGDGVDFPAEVEIFLTLMLEKVIEEMPLPPAEKLYDATELARNLMDWADPDEERRQGGPEDAYYQEQDPPYNASNRPILSVDELRLIEGFDGPLVDALRPYVTVYPYVPALEEGGGINLNTAPTHVLALLFYNDGVDEVLADEELVEQILEVREEGGLVCPGSSDERCTPMNEIVVNEPFPPVSYSSSVFLVRSEARVGEVRRTVEAVMDRTDPLDIRLLSWRAR